jgi:RHS repeat-associated protein
MIDDAQNIHHNEPDVYFYHSDHLGSASWITDNGGLAVQHLQYLPYGERYVDQRISGYSERFTFTGKERDEETGYGYFGARYMDHELMTMWLSVDPMSDKYPSISPYAYCAWNPVKLVDPDGKDTINGTQSKMLSRACKSSYPGMLIFNGHGVPPNEFSPSTSIRFENDRYFAYDGMINMKTSSTIKMFSDFLSEYNDVYKKNTDQGLLTIVILITCRAGTELPIPYANQENIAQSIAKEMPNAIVIAPSWDVTLNKDGENGNMYVYEDPYRQIYGHWNVYNNGKKIDIINNLNKLDALVQEAQNKTLLYRYLIPTKDE